MYPLGKTGSQQRTLCKPDTGSPYNPSRDEYERTRDRTDREFIEVKSLSHRVDLKLSRAAAPGVSKQRKSDEVGGDQIEFLDRDDQNPSSSQ